MTRAAASFLALALLLGLTLGACGKKGDPVPPSDPAAHATDPTPQNEAEDDSEKNENE